MGQIKHDLNIDECVCAWVGDHIYICLNTCSCSTIYQIAATMDMRESRQFLLEGFFQLKRRYMNI